MKRHGETFYLLCVMGLLYCVLVTCETDSLIQVDCGKSKDSPISIRYIGDAYLMYSASNESYCTSVRKSYYLEIENVNKRPECGMRWNENQKKYSIQVHIQPMRVVMEDDRVVHIACYYGEVLTSSVKNVGLTDRWVRTSGLASDSELDVDQETLLPLDLPDAFNISVISLSSNKKMGDVQKVNEGENITLEIEANRDNVDMKLLQISECFIEVAEKSLLSYQYQIIASRCGTGAPLKPHQHFELTKDKMSLIIKDGFEVPKLSFLNSILFRCLAYMLPPGGTPPQSCGDDTSFKPDFYQLMVSGHSEPIRVLQREVSGIMIEAQENETRVVHTVIDEKPKENGTTYLLIKHPGQQGVQDYFHFLIIISLLSFLLLAYTGIVIYMCKLLKKKYDRTSSSKSLNQSGGSSKHCFFDRDIPNV